MNHHASPEFWDRYNTLPTAVQQLARRCFALMKSDPRHPSIQLKKIGRCYAACVGLHYRALAVEDKDGLVWFWIGSHADYDRLINE